MWQTTIPFQILVAAVAVVATDFWFITFENSLYNSEDVIHITVFNPKSDWARTVDMSENLVQFQHDLLCNKHLVTVNRDVNAIGRNARDKEWSQCYWHSQRDMKHHQCRISPAKDDDENLCTFWAKLFTMDGIVKFQNCVFECTDQRADFKMVDSKKNIQMLSNNGTEHHLQINGEFVFAYNSTTAISYGLLAAMHTFGLTHSRTAEPGRMLTAHCILFSTFLILDHLFDTSKLILIFRGLDPICGDPVYQHIATQITQRADA